MPSDECLGFASENGCVDSFNESHVEGHLLSLYAGGDAQRQLDPAHGDSGCESDEEQARVWLGRMGWLHREMEFRERARAMVVEHWTEIAAVAAELLAREVLDETEVESIADATVGDPDAAADLEMYRMLLQSATPAAPAFPNAKKGRHDGQRSTIAGELRELPVVAVLQHEGWRLG